MKKTTGEGSRGRKWMKMRKVSTLSYSKLANVIRNGAK